MTDEADPYAGSFPQPMMVSLGMKVLRPEWALMLSDAPMVATQAYREARAPAYHPTVRLSAIRKYGFGGRR